MRPVKVVTAAWTVLLMAVMLKVFIPAKTMAALLRVVETDATPNWVSRSPLLLGRQVVT